jgi:hypothetical protein
VLQDRDIAEARRDESIERAQFLRRGKPPLLSRRPRASSTPKVDEPASSIEIETGKPSEVVGTDAEGEASPRSAAPMAKPSLPPQVSLDPKELPEPKRSQPAEDASVETPPASPAVAPQQPDLAASTRTPPIDSAEFKKRLRQLDVDLTSMVAEDSSKWNLTLLRQRGEDLVDCGPSPLERGKARLLLDRIAEFASTLPPEAEGPFRPAGVEGTAAEVAKQPDFVTRYDAVGYLMPIVGARPGSPQYQLTDKDGRSLSLVTARPGINLNAYVKKQVGLFGQRGYVASMKKQHIVAERVVNLDVHRR